MKKHRALWVVIIVILVLAAAAAGVWFWLQSRLDETQQAHQTVYAEYQAMTAAVDQATLTVTEDGSPIGDYDMQTLGLRDGLLVRVTSQFSEIDRLSDEQFAALPLEDRLGWAKQELKPTATVTPDLGQLDLSAVLADLQSVRRTAPEDAYIELVDGVYTVHDAVDGDELNLPAVQEGLQNAAAGLAVTPSGAQNASFELTSVDCYRKPAVTTDSLTDTPDSLFRTALAELTVKVDFNKDSEFLPHGEETLTSHDLASILDLDAGGTVTVDEKVLAETISKWATKYNQYDAPFIFDSWVKGLTQIDFVTCDYLIDAQSVMAQIRAQLLTMESGEVDADAACYDKNGKPFSLGESYVEVDFDNQQMTYIKDGRLIVNTNIVSGALNGHQTPTGLYEAHGKEHDVWLKGDDYLVFVKYWVSVVGDLIGLHDASWRDNFGASFYVYGGSHGCVNTPEQAMALIWNLIEDGTPVLMHGQNKWYEPANGNPYETKNPVRGTTSDVKVEPGTLVLTPGSSRIEIHADDVVAPKIETDTETDTDAADASAANPKPVS